MFVNDKDEASYVSYVDFVKLTLLFWLISLLFGTQ
jgi:hypothetical protein